MHARILVTGGGGQLARAIQAIDAEVFAPPRNAMDVSSYDQMKGYCKDKNIGIVIHAGAVTNKFSEDRDEDYILSNVIGTANVTLWCMKNNARRVIATICGSVK